MEADQTDPDQWWRRGAVYQIYPRSFADADGDGVGDINGIRSRLGYLRALNLDAIWINPWYLSPFDDGGYDVADYRQVDPRFGTLDDARHLIAEARASGMRTILDLVPNHTSIAHPWFRDAVDAGPGSAARSRYLIRPGRAGGPPNNWTSDFGGSAWTRLDDGEWYLHLFGEGQADLDWTNDDVRRYFDEVLRFWLDLGVGGFRIDVAHGLAKDLSLRDVESAGAVLAGPPPVGHPHWDRPEVHDIIRRWRTVLDGRTGAMMIGEVFLEAPRLAAYLRRDEYHQAFNFDLIETRWEPTAIKQHIVRAVSQAEQNGTTTTWTTTNHDYMRPSTRLGLPPSVDPRTWAVEGPSEALDVEAGLRRSMAMSLLLMALPGAFYLYQGEELGLPEALEIPPQLRDDPVWRLSGGRQLGRDGCRVPIPWARTGPSLGFGAGVPWLPQPEHYASFSVEHQADDSASPLGIHRRALAARRRLLTRDEEIEWLDAPDDVIAFRRPAGLICIANLSDREWVETSGATPLVNSQGCPTTSIGPETTAWLTIDP